MSQNLAPRATQKLFRRGAHQYYASITREEHEPVLQFGHNLLDVVFESGKNLVGVSNLATEVSDF